MANGLLSLPLKVEFASLTTLWNVPVIQIVTKVVLSTRTFSVSQRVLLYLAPVLYLFSANLPGIYNNNGIPTYYCFHLFPPHQRTSTFIIRFHCFYLTRPRLHGHFDTNVTDIRISNKLPRICFFLYKNIQCDIIGRNFSICQLYTIS